MEDPGCQGRDGAAAGPQEAPADAPEAGPVTCAIIAAMSAFDLPSGLSLARLQDVAVRAARQGARILLERARSGFRVEHKNPVNLVTDADHQSEQAIVRILHEAFPDHQVLAEERGLSNAAPATFRWVIDPLDGTTNFAHGFPAFCVSIGLELEGELILGVVLDPTRDELFVGGRGQGATLNGQPMHVSRTGALTDALLVTGFAYDIRESARNNLDHFGRFALRSQGVRRTGAAALDLCYVACGRLDGYWELKLQPWDMAGGVVIAEEAGGRVTDCRGKPLSIYGDSIVASNGLIHGEMLGVLNEAADA